MLRRKVSVEPPCEPSCVASLLWRPSSRISRASAQLWAIGFSQKTCLPASMAALLIGTCQRWPAAMTTASTDFSDSRSLR